jgi:uncharacterized 2Fe-2S/4Fe-4S cluster protein (DUF4445 family)
MNRRTVRFMPDNRAVEVPEGTLLHHAAAVAGLELKSVCGGEGTCGRCAVRVLSGRPSAAGGNLTARQREQGLVLACRTAVAGDDLVVEAPAESRLADHQLADGSTGRVLAETTVDRLPRYGLSPLARKVRVSLPEPTPTANNSDLSRLILGLREAGVAGEINISLDALQALPEALRHAGWEAAVTLVARDHQQEIIRVEPLDTAAVSPAYGLAIDIGTTSNVVHLVDMETGAVIERRGTYNRQAMYGDDVITRIMHATTQAGGLADLRRAVRETINGLIDAVLLARDLDEEDVVAAVVAGNTTMAHLFLGVWPGYIRLEPYVPAANVFPAPRASETGLAINPAAPVLILPAVASYVGGDIVAGLLATDVTERDEVSLFIDIGTNGEMVLGNREWLVTCSCSMGPCFEGGGITCGTRAVPGAIQRLDIDRDTYEVTVATIGGAPPCGIAGTGLIDALAKLRAAGIIDRAGNFEKAPTRRWRTGDEGPEFVLVWAEDTDRGQRDIVISEADAKNLLRAKGAAYAAIRSMLESVGLEAGAISRVFIAGAFGSYLNLRDSIEIGMLPDLPPERYSFIGNSSVKGARLALMSGAARAHAMNLAAKMTNLELSLGNTFMEEFVSALFLPHTNLALFPSVTEPDRTPQGRPEPARARAGVTGDD